MIRACIKVDLPEPVRPAIRTCCEVPCPSARFCRLVGAGLAQGDVDPGAAVAGPPRLRRGGAMNSKGTSTRLASLRRGADLLDLARGELGRRRAGRGPAGMRPKSGSSQASRRPVQVRWAQYGRRSSRREARGQGSRGIDGHERQHAAGHAAGGDRGQPGGRLLVELGGKVGDDQHAIRLGNLAGHGVVVLDGGVLVPQVFLRHRLHVGCQLGQPFLDLAGVGPDLVGRRAPGRSRPGA